MKPKTCVICGEVKKTVARWCNRCWKASLVIGKSPDNINLVDWAAKRARRFERKRNEKGGENG